MGSAFAVIDPHAHASHAGAWPFWRYVHLHGTCDEGVSLRRTYILLNGRISIFLLSFQSTMSSLKRAAAGKPLLAAGFCFPQGASAMEIEQAWRPFIDGHGSVTGVEMVCRFGNRCFENLYLWQTTCGLRMH